MALLCHPGTLGHAAMFEAAKPSIATIMGWNFNLLPGFVPAGNDTINPMANITLAQAKQICLGLASCSAVTFAGNDPQPEGLISLVYFKGNTDIQSTAGWWSLVKIA